MQKEKKQIQNPYLGLSFDWLWIGIYFIIGITGIRVAGQSNSWKLTVENDTENVSLGSLNLLIGNVRYLKSKSNAWLDVSEAVPVYNGDSISTGEAGVAQLSLLNDTTLNVKSHSLVIPHLEQVPGQGKQDAWGSVTWLFKALPKPIPIIEVKEGVLGIRMTERSKPLKLFVRNQLLSLDNDQQPVSLKIEVNLKNSKFPFTITPFESSRIKLRLEDSAFSTTLTSGRTWAIIIRGEDTRIMPLQDTSTEAILRLEHSVAPYTPKIMSPVHGARFVSNANEREEVTLKWKSLPIDLKAELELRRFDDPEFKAIPELSPSGAIVGLPDGNYIWRVRSINSEGSHSDWSLSREFSVQENARGATPVVVREAEKAKKVNFQERLNREIAATRDREMEETKKKRRALQLIQAKKLEKRKGDEILLKKNNELEQATRQEFLHQKYRRIKESAKERIQLNGVSLSLHTSTKAPIVLNESDASQLMIRLRWTKLAQIENYRFSLFLGSTEIESKTVNTSEIDLPLSSIKKTREEFHYQVSATYPDGKVLSSVLTPISVELESPQPVEPSSDSEQDLSHPVRFLWLHSLAVDHFDFQISNDVEFRDLLYDSRLKDKATVFPATQKGTYYWRVRGSKQDLVSEWSTLRKFYVR